MLGIGRCREILKRHGLVLSDDQLGQLMDILHYLATRVCEQAELERARGGVRGDEKEEALKINQ